jgi:hypothetical protein
MAKRFLTLFVISLLISGCNMQRLSATTVASEAPKPQGPDLYAWDFGRVREGAVVKHNFVLSNDSAKVLNIKDVDTSCGCTASAARKNRLSPGESTVIEVRFNSKGYFGPTQQFVYVNTDSLDNPVLRFIIKADVVK